MNDIKEGDLVVCLYPKEYLTLNYETGLEKGKSYQVRTMYETPSGLEIGVDSRRAIGTFKIGRFIKINI